MTRADLNKLKEQYANQPLFDVLFQKADIALTKQEKALQSTVNNLRNQIKKLSAKATSI